jgi:hypothetical protein
MFQLFLDFLILSVLLLRLRTVLVVPWIQSYSTVFPGELPTSNVGPSQGVLFSIMNWLVVDLPL